MPCKSNLILKISFIKFNVVLLTAIVEEGSYDEDIGQDDGYPHDENDTRLR